MNSMKFAVTKAVVYMFIAGIAPLTVATKGWSETPPKNGYEFATVGLAVALAMLTVLKSYLSDSSVVPKGGASTSVTKTESQSTKSETTPAEPTP